MSIALYNDRVLDPDSYTYIIKRSDRQILQDGIDTAFPPALYGVQHMKGTR